MIYTHSESRPHFSWLKEWCKDGNQWSKFSWSFCSCSVKSSYSLVSPDVLCHCLVWFSPAVQVLSTMFWKRLEEARPIWPGLHFLQQFHGYLAFTTQAEPCLTPGTRSHGKEKEKRPVPLSFNVNTVNTCTESISGNGLLQFSMLCLPLQIEKPSTPGKLLNALVQVLTFTPTLTAKTRGRNMATEWSSRDPVYWAQANSFGKSVISQSGSNINISGNTDPWRT